MNNIEAAIISKRLTDLALLAVCTLIKLHLIPTTFFLSTNRWWGWKTWSGYNTPHTAVAVEGGEMKKLEAKDQIAAQLIL